MSDDDEVMSVLRISTTNENLDTVLAMFPAPRVDAFWRAGEQTRNGRERKNAGANIFLTEKATAKDAIDRTFVLIEARTEMFRKLRAIGAEVSVDFGISVAPVVWTRSVDLDASQLGILAELNIGLTVSAYASGSGATEDASLLSDVEADAPPMMSSAAGEGKDDAKGREEGQDDGEEGK